VAERFYGIRHHGPGSARSLLAAFGEHKPDCILIEGPPDATDVLPLALKEGMQPPVALLIYEPDDPKSYAIYPFAAFSPEWQAIQYGLLNGIPVRFMDLPRAHALALQKAAAAEKAIEEPGAADEAGAPPPERAEAAIAPDAQADYIDPMSMLAEAAGFDDSERWWEYLVEHRQDGSNVFEAVAELLGAAREQLGTPPERDLEYENLREAWMRQTLRAARKDGFQSIAIVCGGWHVSALKEAVPTKNDATLLKGLPKVKTTAAWVPWSYENLSGDSGYGAGVESPGWYDHLWTCTTRGASPTEITAGWLTRVAHLLRTEDMDASPAHVIEAARLADTIAALRGLPLAGLAELNEATLAVFCSGNPMPMAVIGRKLIVGNRLGIIPPDSPVVALQKDLEKTAKRLRLPKKEDSKPYDLDLRKPNDLERSYLLHRLNLLGIPWGELGREGRSAKGTFHEVWVLQWRPEFAVGIIEASLWGTTVYDAAGARVRRLAAEGSSVSALTALVSEALLADLQEAIRFAMRRLDAIAAVSGDVPELMDALVPLAQVMRYGNVRKTDTEAVAQVIYGFVTRICVGLGFACASLDDEAAENMMAKITAMDGAVRMLQNEEHTSQWTEALVRLGDQPVHGLIAGRANRILLDSNVIDADEAGRRLGLALSVANDPAAAGAWADGFLRGSGLVLLLDEKLLWLIDSWVRSLSADAFQSLLPMLRRTFSSFELGERRQLAGHVAAGQTLTQAAAPLDVQMDYETAGVSLATLEAILFPRKTDND
jgi:hypothetical protein